MIGPKVVPGSDPDRARGMAPPSPVTGDDPALRFGDVLAALEEKPDARSASPGKAASVADIFNQRGFFRAVAAIGDSGPTTPGERRIDSVATSAPSVAAAGQVPAIPPASIPPTVRTDGDSGGGVVTLPMARETSGGPAIVSAEGLDQPCAPPAAPIPTTIASVTTRLPVATASAPTTTGRMSQRRPLPDVTPPRAAPQIAVEAGERGLEVVARLAGITVQDRATLRDRIAALLSRHGFRAGIVRIIAGATAGQRRES